MFKVETQHRPLPWGGHSLIGHLRATPPGPGPVARRRGIRCLRALGVYGGRFLSPWTQRASLRLCDFCAVPSTWHTMCPYCPCNYRAGPQALLQLEPLCVLCVCVSVHTITFISLIQLTEGRALDRISKEAFLALG